jgi:hypothetical protein
MDGKTIRAAQYLALIEIPGVWKASWEEKLRGRAIAPSPILLQHISKAADVLRMFDLTVSLSRRSLPHLFLD